MQITNITRSLSAAITGTCLVSAAARADPKCPDVLDVPALHALATQHSTGTPIDSLALHPAIKRFASNTLKSLACVEIVNFYAGQTKMMSDVVIPGSGENKKSPYHFNFANKADGAICGTIDVSASAHLPTSWSDVEKKIHVAVREVVAHASAGFYQDIIISARSMAYRYLPPGGDLPKPTGEDAEGVAWQFQNQIIAGYLQLRKARDQDSSATAPAIAGACVSVLASSSSPNETALERYPSAHQRYARFAADLAKWAEK